MGDTIHTGFMHKGEGAKYEQGAIQNGIVITGGKITNLRDNIGIQNNSEVAHNKKSEKGEDLLLVLLKNLLKSRSDNYLNLLKEEDEDWDELETIVKNYVRPDDILPFNKLIYGVALVCIPGNCFGTAFLADVPNVGVCLLSVGHNFDSLFEEVEYDDGGKMKSRKKNINEIIQELDKYKIWFGNTHGDLPPDVQSTTLEKGKPMNLKLFLEKFNFCGSTCLSGERVIFKRGQSGFQTWVEEDSNAQGDDYFAILLDDNIRNNLDRYGIDLLECGEGKELENELGLKNVVVAIVGHPGHDDWVKYPMRLSYGKEVDQHKTKKGLFFILTTTHYLGTRAPLFSEEDTKLKVSM